MKIRINKKIWTDLVMNFNKYIEVILNTKSSEYGKLIFFTQKKVFLKINDAKIIQIPTKNIIEVKK